MTSTPVPDGYVFTREPLPPEFEHFQQAAARADEMAAFDRRHASAAAEIARRLQAVREQLDQYKKARRK